MARNSLGVVARNPLEVVTRNPLGVVTRNQLEVVAKKSHASDEKIAWNCGKYLIRYARLGGLR